MSVITPEHKRWIFNNLDVLASGHATPSSARQFVAVFKKSYTNYVALADTKNLLIETLNKENDEANKRLEAAKLKVKNLNAYIKELEAQVDSITSFQGGNCQKVCPNCGTVFVGKFCTECGTKYVENENSQKQSVNNVILSRFALKFELTSEGYKVVGTGPRNLSNVIIPSEHEGKPVIEISETAFRGNETIETLTIPSSVRAIGRSAFANCKYLTDISLNDGLLTIGNSAFYNCMALRSITIPKGVVSIGDSAFYGCYKLIEVRNLSSLSLTLGNKSNGYLAMYAKNIYREENQNGNIFTTEDCYEFFETNGLYYLTGYKGTATNLMLPEKIENHTYEIHEAFHDNKSIGSVVIPNGVKIIGMESFSNCVSLINVEIPNSVISMGAHSFSGCNSLTKVCVPNGVTRISDSLFSGCKKLDSLIIPEGVDTIEEYAFGDCSDMTSIKIPDSVKKIGRSAFSGCSSLKDIIIPKGVPSVEYDTFWCCTSLESILIPDSVKSIGGSAFYKCISLKNIFYLGSQDDWEKIKVEKENTSLTGASVFIYSDKKRFLKKCWHYDENGKPVIW